MSEDQNKDQGGFGLPEDYFKSSALNLKARMEWLEEHRAFPALLAMNRETGFTVPEGYFTKTDLELAAYPTLKEMKSLRPFMAPSGYFEEAALAIREKI